MLGYFDMKKNCDNRYDPKLSMVFRIKQNKQWKILKSRYRTQFAMTTSQFNNHIDNTIKRFVCVNF